MQRNGLLSPQNHLAVRERLNIVYRNTKQSSRSLSPNAPTVHCWHGYRQRSRREPARPEHSRPCAVVEDGAMAAPAKYRRWNWSRLAKPPGTRGMASSTRSCCRISAPRAPPRWKATDAAARGRVAACSTACRSRSRNRLMSPAGRPRAAILPCAAMWPGATPWWCSACAMLAPSCLARPTFRSACVTGRATTTSTAPHAIRAIRPVPRAAHRAEARRPCAPPVGVDVGSDIGSSLRNPAHYCGIFSLKPSHGLVPLSGHGTGPARFGEQDINVAGPLARSARDLEPVLRAIAGPHGDQAQAYRLELPACPHHRLADFRVAVLPTHPQAEADGEVAAQIEQLGHWLARRARAWHGRSGRTSTPLSCGTCT